MRLPETEITHQEKSYIKTIRELKEKNFIENGSPLWWSTDYKPDPREYLPFDKFRQRLIHLGKCKTSVVHSFLHEEKSVERDVYLYPKPKVPITILNLDVSGEQLSFLVTARPYHQKELYNFHSPSAIFPHSLWEHAQEIKKLPEFIRSGGIIDLPEHFYPHIRGLFAGRRGNHFFWYNFHLWGGFGQTIKDSLKSKKLSFVNLYQPPMDGRRTYSEVWFELEAKKNLVDHKKPRWFDYSYSEVSAEEFIEDYQKTNENLVVFYPLRHPDIENTLPLVISNKTHQESKIRKSAVLGIYAENGRIGRCRQGGILRIKNYEFAKEINKSISEDFGIPIDTILFIPQKGRPKYERIS